jgi:hypothetical protein
MKVSRWILNFLHIETLFIIGTVFLLSYFIWKERSVREGLLRLNDVTNDMFGIPKDLVKKKKKKRYKHQERCREIFEQIFHTPFKSVRPDWLKNPVSGGHNLELDGFAPDIRTPIGRGLAFEYDGAQHSKYIPRFHPNGPDDFIYQVKKDSLKDLRCKEQGVMLIRIPHFVDYSDLERYIRQKLSRAGMLR